MNYFELYQIPVSFTPDEAVVKERFYALSKQYHPDFYTLHSAEKQAEVLEMSTLNNEAYATLSDFDKCLKYVLTLLGALEEEGKATLSQVFLMQMMDVNEQLMELEFDFDEAKYKALKQDLALRSLRLYESVADVLHNFGPGAGDEEVIAIKNYYYKRRYLLRIQENLSKFASR